MSLSAVLSPGVDMMRTRAIGVVVGPRDQSYRLTAARDVDAFDASGKPKSHLRGDPARRTGQLIVLRLAEHLDIYARIATAIWAILSTAVVLYLIASGRLDVTKFELQK
jgi:hypothetical protein